MAHWAEVLEAAGVPYGVVNGPAEVIKDPQLAANNIVVPLEGVGGKLTSTVSSPIQVEGVAKQPAHRGPELGEHNEEILRELGFDAAQIRAFAERQVTAARRPSAAA
jgi:formyl-CoA transferase